ncbi:hypothetical protein M758_10G177600 [Ceratodon purpureus]|nr:hypothetical protein M758_10G177600 [Ceratodon purpureus]
MARWIGTQECCRHENDDDDEDEAPGTRLASDLLLSDVFYDHVNSAGLQLLYTPLQCSSGTCPRSHLLFLHAELLLVKINSRMTGSELWDASNFVIQRKLGHVQEMFQAMK